MPTIDDLIADLNGATHFSTLDLSSGYNQLQLAPESRYVTTFSTHINGVNAASEIFQEAIGELLSGLSGCKNISDDIIVFGKGQEEHIKNPRGILQRLKENNLHLNEDKCEFSKTEFKFYGHIFNYSGLKPDPRKVEAIHKARPPQSHSEVSAWYGTVCISIDTKLCHHRSPTVLADVTGHAWKWEEEKQRTFNALKEALVGNQVMSYFDPRKKTEIIVDASPFGLGGLLIQEGKVLSYASHALSDVESSYSQTERGMLAVVSGVEHFHLYV